MTSPVTTRPVPLDRELVLDAARLRQREVLLDPWKVRPIYLRPPRNRVLIVIDGAGSFGTADFGLRSLLDALAVPPGPWVVVDVTTAHRRSDPTADVSGFRFTDTALAGFDQVWLFGVERAGGLEPSEAELRVLSEFMDSGGGVFATGDHEDLGVALCGRVPRVRSMRAWHWPNPGPNGEPVAPRANGPDRHDTLLEGDDPGFSFDDQSDDHPQRISPRLYSTGRWNHYFSRAYPHPLLCGPRGIIRVLPDHPHEGACLEPTDLTATLTLDGRAVTEYPGGVAPQVIAFSSVAGRPAGVKGPLNPTRFGAIGAYDGHRAGVGRVAVDATWHHFFNINLSGEDFNPDPVKSVGFAATPAGYAAYQDITAYYRNLAVWLARPSTQTAMWWRAMWWTRWNHRIAMDLRPSFLGAAEKLPLGELVRVGAEARDALGRVAGQCTAVRWIPWEVIRLRWPKIWEPLQPHLDPWLVVEAVRDDRELVEPVADLALPVHAEVLLDAVFGAVVYGVATAFPDADEDARAKAEDVDWLELVAPHVERALQTVAEHTATAAQDLRRFSGSLGGKRR